MRVFEVMSTDVETIAPSVSAGDAVSTMRLKGIRHLVVKDGREIVGVLSERDVHAAPVAMLRQQTAGDVMTRSAVSIGPRDTMRRAANLMRGRSIGCLPVVDRGKLVGIVTTTDLLDLAGRGGDRPARGSRPALHYRTPHRKRHGSRIAW